MLQARLNELDLQANIAAKRKEIDGTANFAGATSAGSTFNDTTDPTILSVAGLKGQLEAVLAFPAVWHCASRRATSLPVAALPKSPSTRSC